MAMIRLPISLNKKEYVLGSNHDSLWWVGNTDEEARAWLSDTFPSTRPSGWPFSTQVCEMSAEVDTTGLGWNISVRTKLMANTVDLRLPEAGSIIYNISVVRKSDGAILNTKSTNIPNGSFYGNGEQELANINTTFYGIIPDELDDPTDTNLLVRVGFDFRNFEGERCDANDINQKGSGLCLGYETMNMKVGYGLFLKEGYAYMDVDFSQVPLKPTVKWSEWYHTFDQQYDNISENSIAIRFTVDQPAEEVACIITNLTDILNGSANPRHSGIIYIPKAKLGDHSINGQQAYYFNIRNTDWNGIKYAYKYRVLFGVKNKNGIWNTGGNTWNPNVSPIPVYCSMDAATKNHLPRLVTTGHNNNNIVTGCTFRLEEVLFKGHTDIKVDIISHSCTAGRLINISEEYSHDAAYWDENGDGTDDEVVQILYGAIQPDTEIEFNVTLAATRRLEPVSQYGLHTISFGKSGKTLRPAFISSMNNFFFYDAVKYTLFNESFFGCTVKFIVDLATDYLIWSDTHDRTVAYKNNQEITHNMSQTELDNTYLKWPRDVNEISIRMDVVTVGDYGTYTRSVTVKCKLNGNHLTGHIGVGGIPRRAKCWIGTENGPKRCILWIGVDGKPRRCI